MRIVNVRTTFIVGCFMAMLTMPVSSEGQKTLASTLDIYVFPTAGQDSKQQSTDEASCYSWAVSNTGSDPFEVSRQAEQHAQQSASSQQQASQAGAGSGARGAFRGAAVGALIGEIADDDAGKGAAIGATAGLLRGRRLGRQEQARAQQQAQQQSQNQQRATAEQMNSFKRAFSVCLEAKGYMVK